MKITLAFDVYGTLVDPCGMAAHLAAECQDTAEQFAEFWREKQLEYSFRRGLMQNYADFAACTRAALDFTCERFARSISDKRKKELLELYQTLPVFSDVERSLRSLSEKYRVFAFSNGRPEEVRSVLAHGKIEQFFIGIISAHEVRSFKPNPAVYAHARRVSGAWSSPFWVVSSNPWDVIGARSAGLSAAWVQRSDKKIFDPWGIDPSLIVHSLSELRPAVEQYCECCGSNFAILE